MTDDYYNKEGKAFTAGLETLDKYELMSLANYMKATVLVNEIQEDDPESPLPRTFGVNGYEAQLAYDEDQQDGWFRIIKNGEVKVETNDPKHAVYTLAHWFDHELGLRLLGVKEE